MSSQPMPPYEFNAHGKLIRFHLPDPRDHIPRIILNERGFYERAMLEDIGPRLPEDAVVVDVGANIGNHTLFFSAVLGARTIAVEPNPVALEQLRTNIAINGLGGLVEVHEAALGASPASGKVVNDRPEILGLARIEASPSGAVAIRRLDDIIGDRHVDLIKIDVEGMEAEVLRGAGATLARCRPWILVEAADREALRRVETVLRPAGYRKLRVYNATPTYLFGVGATQAPFAASVAAAIVPCHAGALPPTRQIVAGMATVAGNEVALRATVMSLLPQIDRLFLYLNGFSRVPDFLRDHPKISCRLDPDGSRYGDAGKFWGLEQVSDAVYVTCDDDMLYPPDFVSRIVAELAELGGRAAVGVHGAIVLQPNAGYYHEASRVVFHFQQALMRRRRVHVPATSACAFHSSVVRMTLEDFKHPNMADIWLAQYLQANRIPAYVVPRSQNWLRPIEVQRPSIYAQSVAGTGTSYDSSRPQDAVLATMYPVSMLCDADAAALPPVHLVEAAAPELLERFLAARVREAREVVFVLVCDRMTGAMRAAALNPALRSEVHLLGRDTPLAPAYAEMLGHAGDRLRVWTLTASAGPIERDRADWQKVLSGFATAKAAEPPPPVPAAIPPPPRSRFDSGAYWETRYARGGNSGVGSYNQPAAYKAHVLNAFAATQKISRVAELGAGDGNQLRYLDFEAYTGFDVSRTAIEMCRRMHARRDGFEFVWLGEEGLDLTAHAAGYDLALSLDVLYHLIEDEVYHTYLDRLFSLSSRYVVIFASNFDAPDRHGAVHVRHRRFTDDVASRYPRWTLLKQLNNPYRGTNLTDADFFVFGLDAAEDLSFLDAVDRAFDGTPPRVVNAA